MTTDITCAYGENAWQAPAVLVGDGGDDPLAIHRFELLEGTAPSYNNLVEIDRELQTITHAAAAFARTGDVPALTVGTKHGNACGMGAAASPPAALERMLVGDPRAIFGGCVMTTFPIGADEASTLLHHASETRRLLDLVCAPAVSEEAIELLGRKGGKCRLMANPALASPTLDVAERAKTVRGGVIRQPAYTFVLDLADPEVAATAPPSPQQARDLLLAWAIGSTSNSNTVTLVRDGQLLGNGVGQQDRVGGAALAIRRALDAGHEVHGAVAYSDSFFPFPDAGELLIEAGVAACFSTSGSVRDDVVRQAFLDAGVPLVQLPDRLARGFFGH